jgi:membrane protein implicated in regulation of membrane protease activity
LGLKDWNPLKVIALGVVLCLIGGVGLTVWRINLGLILFLALGIYATLLGIRYYVQRKRES